jgi:hypothetical protein
VIADGMGDLMHKVIIKVAVARLLQIARTQNRQSVRTGRREARA